MTDTDTTTTDAATTETALDADSLTAILERAIQDDGADPLVEALLDVIEALVDRGGWLRASERAWQAAADRGDNERRKKYGNQTRRAAKRFDELNLAAKAALRL